MNDEARLQEDEVRVLMRGLNCLYDTPELLTTAESIAVARAAYKLGLMMGAR